MEFTIEKNIPVHSASKSINAKVLNTCSQLEVGDSFLAPKKSSRAAVAGAMNRMKHTEPDKKFISRTTDAGLRIWRIK